VPELRPFRALRYRPTSGIDLSSVICPPYDVISRAERDRLATLDAHNAVRIELPAPSGGPAGGSAYEAAAGTFAAWLAEGALARDERALIYPYEQHYAVGGGADADGARRAARGFFCLLRLEPYGPASGVRPHEATLSAPKEDRFRLLSAVRANLSPVLLLYDDGAQGEGSAALLDQLMAGTPVAWAAGQAGSDHRLWAIDPDQAGNARELLGMAGRAPLTIADGHHRYETALRYRSGHPAAPGADFVLALLYDVHSGGLSLLPWHRLLRGVPPVDRLVQAAAAYFDVQPCQSAGELVRAVAGAREPSGRIGLWTREGGFVLDVDRTRAASVVDPAAAPPLRWLDVSVLSGTLGQMIGVSVDRLAADDRLTYSSEALDAVAAVDSGAVDACFLLQPTPAEAVLAVAAAGAYMPAKSTYFQPKAATGLVFNPLSE
jgi:uncharacterized protein (DUF1015 family)